MAVTGDDITHGDHHQAKAVNDLDLLELLGAIQTLQTGRDLAGVDLKGAPQFLVGATVKVPTSDAAALEQELADLDQKIAAGARFFITQPVFDVGALEKFSGHLAGRQAAIIPTVLLLKSVGMARYINRHLETKIPEASSPGFKRPRTGCGNACRSPRKSSAALKAKGFSGVNLSTIGWEDKLPAILAAAGLEFGV